jgi:hypothetical protein
MARPRSTPAAFDPRALIAALERHRVDYILIGAFARVLHGTGEVTDELDISPSTKDRNLQRLEAALAEVAPSARIDTLTLADPPDPVTRVETTHGTLTIVPEPAGTRGYDDLKRTAGREHLGQGLRPLVASTGDLGRMLNTLRRDGDIDNLRALRRAEELQQALGRGIER